MVDGDGDGDGDGGGGGWRRKASLQSNLPPPARFKRDDFSAASPAAKCWERSANLVLLQVKPTWLVSFLH